MIAPVSGFRKRSTGDLSPPVGCFVAVAPALLDGGTLAG
jgi:hypothetical protein